MSRFTERVWMHHPELDRTIQFFRSQIPELGAAGWVEADPPPEPEPKPAKQESKPSGRSRPRPTSEGNES
jgi:hypothetical protein